MNNVKGLSIACIDPGGETGLWWGCFSQSELATGPWKSMQSAMQAKRMQFHQIDSDVVGELQVAVEIDQWLQKCDRLTRLRTNGKIKKIDLIIFEDFLLRAQTMDRALLSPVRITRGVEQLLHARGAIGQLGKYQQASAMKSVVTHERIVAQGFKWTYARRHEWDAFSHGHLFLRNYCNKLGK